MPDDHEHDNETATLALLGALEQGGARQARAVGEILADASHVEDGLGDPDPARSQRLQASRDSYLRAKLEGRRRARESTVPRPGGCRCHDERD